MSSGNGLHLLPHQPLGVAGDGKGAVPPGDRMYLPPMYTSLYLHLLPCVDIAARHPLTPLP